MLLDKHDVEEMAKDQEGWAKAQQEHLLRLSRHLDFNTNAALYMIARQIIKTCEHIVEKTLRCPVAQGDAEDFTFDLRNHIDILISTIAKETNE